MNDDRIINPPAALKHADEELVRAAQTAIKRAGEACWQAADALSELARRGWTQQRIAQACGVSQPSCFSRRACRHCLKSGRGNGSGVMKHRVGVRGPMATEVGSINAAASPRIRRGVARRRHQTTPQTANRFEEKPQRSRRRKCLRSMCLRQAKLGEGG